MDLGVTSKLKIIVNKHQRELICRRESGYSSPANTPSSVHGGGMEVFDFPESVR